MEVRAIPGGNPLTAVARVLGRHEGLAVPLVGPADFEAAAALGERFLADGGRANRRRGEWGGQGPEGLRGRTRAKAARGQREHPNALQTARSRPPGSPHIAPYRRTGLPLAGYHNASRSRPEWGWHSWGYVHW